MRFNINTGTLVALVFLAVAAVAHALVYWVPVWKTKSLLRYNPKHGWKPVSHGWKPRKPFFNIGHLNHKGWKSRDKKCHLCHILPFKHNKGRNHHHHHFHHTPKSFFPPVHKEFGFNGGFGNFGGFGGGKKGHAWGGWDW